MFRDFGPAYPPSSKIWRGFGFLAAAGQNPKRVIRAITVLNTGRVNPRCYQMAAGVGYDMALAALDPFSRIIARAPAVFTGFDALAVDYTCCRLAFPALCFTRKCNQFPVDFRKQVLGRPQAGQCHGNRGNRSAPSQQGKIPWRKRPRAPRRYNVLDRIPNSANIDLPGPPKTVWTGQPRHHNRPFLVRDIT